MRPRRILSVPFLLTLVSSSAWAAQQPGWLEETGLTLASGEQVRLERSTGWQTPSDRADAWAQFSEQTEGRWRALWDRDTKIPLRIFGSGIAAPGSVASPEAAEAIAKSVLPELLGLLAPGAAVSDFVLVANTLDPSSGMRTVAWQQQHKRIPILGGQISVRYKNNRLFVIASEALPHVDGTVPTGSLDARKAHRTAAKWIHDEIGVRTAPKSGPSAPLILPVITIAGDIGYHTVVEVEAESASPVGRWSVYLDARTGAPVARRQTLRFAGGTLLYNAPERSPVSGRVDFAAPAASVTVDGQPAETDSDGNITWSGDAPAAVTARLSGSEVIVANDAGPEATVDFTLDDGGTYTWRASSDELVEAQITTFIASSVVKSHLKAVAPSLRWLQNARVDATVNINGSCNAFSDGTTINFFRGDRQCENTGRLPDVVYHEFGHSFHAHVIIRGTGDFDTALSEGASDYLSATITGDPGTARGFFGSTAPLRHIDPSGREARWPDDISRDPHETGLIFAGAMWDLRKGLVGVLGETAGAARADALWYAALQRSADIPSSYVEVLAGDDDDGNLSNGTPNACLINSAFAAHGLADPETSGPAIDRPQRQDMHIVLPMDAGGPECPGTGVAQAVVFWKLREGGAGAQSVTMTEGATGYEMDIPEQPEGNVVQYRVEVTLESGDTVRYPSNQADPFYEFYLGDVTPLYCTNFESDPLTEGWDHELVTGVPSDGADDWQWGVPAGTEGSGDPAAAFSGNRVFGNDLGGGNFNGKYQAGKVNALVSPPVGLQGHRNLRIQYRRWLTVEDGAFDQASILANGREVWSNLSASGDTHHEDKEWRFHDVDISNAVQDGEEAVQIRFQLASDGGLEFGGWNIDDFCLVGVGQAQTCGNGKQDPGEACDDGNLVDGDGCQADCSVTPAAPVCGDGTQDPGEACDDGNLVDGDGCQANCSITPPGTTNACDLDPNSEACKASNPSLDSNEGGGCGCEAANADPTDEAPWALGLLLFGWVALRRRRR